VNAFASDLQHPRWLYTLPNGDVLVAETAAPPRPEDGKGIKGAVMKKFMTEGGFSGALGQSHLAAARCQRRRRRRDQDRVPDRAQFALWHGARSATICTSPIPMPS
jgi:glucose/arabinose dehydrogenase